MQTFQQHQRPIGVETPFGKDRLVLQSFAGGEQLSGLFRFDLKMISHDGKLKPSEIVGKPIDFFVRYPDQQQRWFNGIVNRFIDIGQDDRTHHYRAEVVPWLWFLTRGSDCRTHETDGKKDAKEIISALLNELGFGDHKWDVKRTLDKRHYCVQYRETHYDFLTRLLEEEGIYYYFRHEKGKHTLVMADHANGVFDCRDATARLLSNLSQPESTDNLTGWNHEYNFTSGKFAHTDYDFENPTTSLLLQKNSLVSLNGNSRLELFDFPGAYVQKSSGDSLAGLRIEEEEARYNVVRGGSECRSFSPGGRFKMDKHHNDGESGGQWVLTSVEHAATVGGSYTSGPERNEEIYHNTFSCVPADKVWRPARRSRAGVYGIQTAVVVGPSGEEIYTDQFGRVKVQFHWDRRGMNDDKSSWWIRVSQVHAGQGWGMMDLPRIGEEVIVSFLDGNPDRPIIIGRVYNGQNQPPFGLPAEKTRRGNTTRSHKADGFNELSMDDAAGAEQIRIHAQYNMDTNVRNNQTLTVGVDRTNTIGRNETIGVGENQEVSVGSDATMAVGGSQTVTIGADHQMKVDRSIMVEAGTKIVFEAGAAIEFVVGSSGITIDQSGVTIKGPVINVDGTATIDMKSPATTVAGDATLVLKGGMTMIN